MGRQSLDEIFFNDMYHKMYRSMYLYTLGHCECYWEVEDMLQETFREAYQHMRQLKNSPNPEGYLMNILKSKILKYKARQRKYEKEREALSKLSFPYVCEQDWEMWDFCRTVLNGKEYGVLYGRYGEGLSIAQLAGRFHISEGACKMRLKRSLTKLKKAMQ